MIVLLLGLGLVFLAFLYWIYRSTTSLAQKVRQLLSGIKEGICSIAYMKKKMAVHRPYHIYLAYVFSDVLCGILLHGSD